MYLYFFCNVSNRWTCFLVYSTIIGCPLPKISMTLSGNNHDSILILYGWLLSFNTRSSHTMSDVGVVQNVFRHNFLKMWTIGWDCLRNVFCIISSSIDRPNMWIQLTSTQKPQLARFCFVCHYVIGIWICTFLSSFISIVEYAYKFYTTFASRYCTLFFGSMFS